MSVNIPITGNPNLAKVERAVATDLAALKTAAAAVTTAPVYGVIDGLLVTDPTSSSSQSAGTGATTWNVNVTAGAVMVGSVEKYHAAQADLSVHASTMLLTNGQSVYAWVLEQNSGGTLTTVVVKGTAATTGAEVAPTTAQIVAALGAGVTYTKLALCHLSRTGDTTLVQTQANWYRTHAATYPASAITLQTVLT